MWVAQMMLSSTSKKQAGLAKTTPHCTATPHSTTAVPPEATPVPLEATADLLGCGNLQQRMIRSHKTCTQSNYHQTDHEPPLGMVRLVCDVIGYTM